MTPNDLFSHTTALTTEIFAKFSDLMALVELDQYNGREQELLVSAAGERGRDVAIKGGGGGGGGDLTVLSGLETGSSTSAQPAAKSKCIQTPLNVKTKPRGGSSSSSSKSRPVTTTLSNYIARASRYSNSRLAANLAPMRTSLEGCLLYTSPSPRDS